MESEEVSPWDSSSEVSYKLVPSINPKTKKPVQIYACTACGGAVISKKRHDQWHREQSSWP